jgi:DNA-binding transcriptional LysR family regulator
MGEYNERLIFKNYEYFRAIIEAGGVTKAAEKLFVSQSAVSKYLKRLEDNVGHKLFNRESHPLCLTEAGELYYKYVKQIFEQEKEFKSNIDEWKKGNRGVIKIGMPFFHSAIFFPAILLRFSKEYPDIRIKAHEGSPSEIVTMLDQNKVDFAVVFQPHNHDNIIFEHLLHERILFVINKSNHIAKTIDYDPKLEVNKISNANFLLFEKEPFVLMKKGHNSRQLVQLVFDKLHFKPNIVLETQNINTAINLVKTGSIAAFIPEMMLKLEEQKHDLLFFHLDDSILQRELGIAYKSAGTLPKQHRQFIDLAKELILNCAK